MDIKISIVTVTYNSDKYIKNTLDSILNHTEVLVDLILTMGVTIENSLFKRDS